MPGFLLTHLFEMPHYTHFASDDPHISMQSLTKQIFFVELACCHCHGWFNVAYMGSDPVFDPTA